MARDKAAPFPPWLSPSLASPKAPLKPMPTTPLVDDGVAAVVAAAAAAAAAVLGTEVLSAHLPIGCCQHRRNRHSLVLGHRIRNL